MVDIFWVYISYSLTFLVLAGFFIWHTNIKYRDHFLGKSSSLWHQIKLFKASNPKEGRILQILLLLMQLISAIVIIYVVTRK